MLRRIGTRNRAKAHDRAEADHRSLVKRAIDEMLEEETKSNSDPWAEGIPASAVALYTKITVLAPYPQKIEGKTVTHLEFNLREMAPKSFAKKSEIVDLIGLAGLPPGLLDMAIRPSETGATNRRDTAIQLLNKLCPGVIYLYEPILDLIIEKTVIAAASLATRDVLEAKEWLRRTCIPKAPGTDRFQLSGRHFMMYPKLYAEVVYIREVYDAAQIIGGMDQNAARTFTLGKFEGLSRIDSEWLDLILPIAKRGARVQPAPLVDRLMAYATGYVEEREPNAPVLGFAERTIRHERSKWLPDWPQQSVAIKRAMLEAAANLVKKKLKPVRA